MNLYIATALERLADARSVAVDARERGWRVVSDWHDASPTRDEERVFSAHTRRAIALHNARRICQANAMLVLCDRRCRSTLAEIGIAWMRGAAVVAVGDLRAMPLMAELIPHVVDDVTDALVWLERANGRCVA